MLILPFSSLTPIEMNAVVAAVAAVGIEVVGVDNNSDGRSCSLHKVCGHFVTVGDKLFCRWQVQQFHDRDEPEACVQVFKMAADGGVGCHVGYLPLRLVMTSRDSDGIEDLGMSYNGKWMTVVHDLRISDNTAERSRSKHNYGIVLCQQILDDPRFVGVDPFETRVNLSDDDGSTDEDDE